MTASAVPIAADLPRPQIRTLGGAGPLDLSFGSCRVALPHSEPYVLSADQSEQGFEYDALHVLAGEMARGERSSWPRVLMLLGDQAYVDEGSPRTRERIRAKRSTSTAPGGEVTDFEEYSWLYQESWGEPLIRWLLASVSTSMLWDDHDMSDDWEHLRVLAGGDAAEGLVARAGGRRDRQLLGLPAHREPPTVGARGE